MIFHNVVQGSDAWKALRRTTRNASEAPAMLGVSRYKSRSDLVAEKATGIEPEITPFMAERFAEGHRVEALARPMVEKILGESLTQFVATDDDGYLLASSDGATELCDIGMECKLWNDALAASVKDGIVPESHAPQLDQSIAVFGFEKMIFIVTNGTPEKTVWCWYETTPEKIARIMSGWKQFDADVAAYVPEVKEAKPILTAKPLERLPALMIEVTGRVTSSNLVEFKQCATAVIKSIKTELVTDQDFVDAIQTVKDLTEIEDNAKRAKQNALDQTASIAELHRALDEVIKMSGDVRKALNKKITEEKDSRKTELVNQAKYEFSIYVDALNKRIGGFMPAIAFDAAAVIKGLSSLDSMKKKIEAAIANAKVEASTTADKIEANISSLDVEGGQSWRFLFPDLSAVCNKAEDDFAAMLAARQATHRAAEETRLEAEREKIRAEEQAKAQREADEKAAAEKREADAKAAAEKAEQDRIDAEAIRKLDEDRRAAQTQAAADALAALPKIDQVTPSLDQVIHAVVPEQVASAISPAPTLKLGDITSRLGFTVTAEFLSSLGFEPATTEKNAKLYRSDHFPVICRFLIKHIEKVANEAGEPLRDKKAA